MKLTFGDLSIITDTLAKSLAFANWNGFTKENREAVLDKLYNDQSLTFDISVVKDSKDEENE